MVIQGHTRSLKLIPFKSHIRLPISLPL